MAKVSRELFIEADARFWEVFDAYRVHLSRVGKRPPPSGASLAGAILLHFFLNNSPEIFEEKTRLDKEEILERFGKYLDPNAPAGGFEPLPKAPRRPVRKPPGPHRTPRTT